MSEVSIKPDIVIHTTDRIIDLLQSMDEMTRDLLRKSKELDNNLQEQTSKEAIEISNAIIDMIGKTKAFVIEKTEYVRNAANMLLKVEKKAADNRRGY